MTTQPATLTNYILHLLQDAGNREKFNQFTEEQYPFVGGRSEIYFDFGEGYGSYGIRDNFNYLDQYYQREIIRIALLSLDEFQVEAKNTEEQICFWDGEDWIPTYPSLAEQYGSMLYLKSIKELDEIFKEEGITL